MNPIEAEFWNFSAKGSLSPRQQNWSVLNNSLYGHGQAMQGWKMAPKKTRFKSPGFYFKNIF